MKKRPLKWRLIVALGVAINTLLWLLSRVLGKRRQAIVLSTILEQLQFVYEQPIQGNGTLRFYASAYKPAWRGFTLYAKQPEVPRWIDTFEDHSVFWDVGANVGVYSLYAAKCKAAQVVAFEPESANYFILTRNIALNCLGKAITPYSIALAERMQFDRLNLFHMAIGGSRHAFGDLTKSWSSGSDPIFSQGMVAFAIDDLVFTYGFPFPHHIKIDVDGIESEIISGAPRVLADMRLRSVLIEGQEHRPNETRRMQGMLESFGLHMIEDAGANQIYRRTGSVAPIARPTKLASN